MRDSGRLAAAISILADFDARRVPLKTAIADWSRNARYAGAKDRATISGLCLDALRRRHTLAAAMGEDTPRAVALGAYRFLWGMSADATAEAAAEEPHGPGALSDEERDRLSATDLPQPDEDWRAGDFPDWTAPMMARAFGERASAEGAALAQRADVDLRLNTLKADPEKAMTALVSVKAKPAGLLTTAARIPAPPSNERAASITVIPAFNRGWVEVQDLGSQIAAAAAGEVAGKQVLDFCAGGGGKTLALAAMMKNTGQLFAWDRDARRLKPLYARAKRAGVRNLQVRSPAGGETLDDLKSRMDVVFVDAPCSGAGTWRRHPDTKWRLTEQQLATRIDEQNAVLAEAKDFVKPGGALVYVTCSMFLEENEDRLAGFLSSAPDFDRADALEAIDASGLLTVEGRAALAPCRTDAGDLRLTPARISADGFFVAVLRRSQ